MLKRIKQFISITLIMLLVVGLFTETRVDAAAIKINKSKLTLEVGKTATLKINGTKKKAKWRSSNKSVATIGLTAGKVIANKKGTVTLTGTIGKKKYTCKVTVINKDYSKWILFETDNFDFVREGMLKGEIIHFKDNYYYISPGHYNAVIEPILESMESSTNEGMYSGERNNVLDPDAEYEIINETKSNSKEELAKKIYNLRRTGFASTETLDTKLGKAYLEFCDVWVSETELKNIYKISTEWDWPDNQLYLLIGIDDKYIIENTPSIFISGEVYTDGIVKYQYLEKFERDGESFEIKQYFFDRKDLINKGIIKY